MTRRASEAPLSHSFYRLVRSTNRAYAFAVLWCYIAAFVLAFGLMFIFPPGTLLLVFLGVFGLVAAVGGAHLIGAVEHLLARRLIRQGRCPRCGALDELRPMGGRVRSDDRSGDVPAVGHRNRTVCDACDAAFERWGGEIESVAPMIGSTV